MPEIRTLERLAAALADGKTSSRALVEECLAKIEDSHGEGARTFLHVDRAGALAQADAMDLLRRNAATPSKYAGIPISIKDLFDISGQATRAGSIVLADAPAATSDAAAVARLRRAGFVLIGRTNMSEFAFSGLGVNPHYGTPRNPWDRANERIPGGSSSGAAVSVADAMAHAALGTDTGGSCRIPAAFTGLVGFKPTARRVPAAGMIPLSETLDSIGPIARTVACCHAMDAILSQGLAPERIKEIAPARLTVALVRNYVLDGMDKIVSTAFERAVSTLAKAGVAIRDVEIPALSEIPAINRKGGFSAAESYAWHRKFLATRAERYDARVRVRIMRGAEQSAADYIDLKSQRRRLIASVASTLDEFDAAIMPTVPIVAPKLSEIATDEAFAAVNMLVLRNPSVVNMIDGCAISLPVHECGDAPVGLAVFGPRDADQRILRIAATLERLFRPGK
jgi:aspartyl-tRNA(Asn)/glutamyl-tRNA(Gln) amidotransferase subunit A